jgi:hypothetical protein
MDPASSSLVEADHFSLFVLFGGPGCSGVASLLIASWFDLASLLRVYVFCILFGLRGSLFP